MQTKDSYLQKEKVVKAIRAFFDEREFHEIIAPVLSETIPAETNIHPFTTTWKALQGNREMYLATSPERSLKLALATGIGNCYSIGHSFRNLEQSGPNHFPEFLMLEWYREDARMNDIMQDVQNLLLSLKITLNSSMVLPTDTWPHLSLVSLFQKHVGIPLESIIQDEAVKTFATARGYTVEDATWHDLFDQIFLNEIEPYLPKTPFFLVDFPARISRLCAVQVDRPYLAERFEVYINGIEVGNGNTENTDTDSIRKYFKEKRSSSVDEEFLQALEHMQKNTYAGIGMGIKRLISVLQYYN